MAQELHDEGEAGLSPSSASMTFLGTCHDSECVWLEAMIQALSNASSGSVADLSAIAFCRAGDCSDELWVSVGKLKVEGSKA